MSFLIATLVSVASFAVVPAHQPTTPKAADCCHPGGACCTPGASCCE